MQNKLLSLRKFIYEDRVPQCTIQSNLSFAPFVRHLKKKMDAVPHPKSNFYRYALAKIGEYAELEKTIDTAQAADYPEVLDVIYTALSPLLTDEDSQLWALSAPGEPEFFYGTNSFYETIGNMIKTGSFSIVDPEKAEAKKMMNLYGLIAERLFHVKTSMYNTTVHRVMDTKTGLETYYRLGIDWRFVDVYSEGDMAQPGPDLMDEFMRGDGNALDLALEHFPLEQFRFEGFCVITLKDVTADYVLDAIKNMIISHNDCDAISNKNELEGALQTLFGSNRIRFNLLPFFHINGKPLLRNNFGLHSLIYDLAGGETANDHIYRQFVTGYLEEPRKLIFLDISEKQQEDSPVLRLLAGTGKIRSYALFPMYYSGRFVGCLELYSKEAAVFNAGLMPTVAHASDLLGQLLQNIITDFNSELAGVITDRFTPIQDAVRWRFNEAAYNYLNEKYQGTEKPAIEPIVFEDVYPFYGAVDIRNSTIERNDAIRKDLFEHFRLLGDTLKAIKVRVPEAFKDDIMVNFDEWLHEELSEISDRVVLKLDDYLRLQMAPFLRQLRDTHAELNGIVETYFESTHPQRGRVFEHRQRLEKSMQTINQHIGTHLLDLQKDLNAVFPGYFEKFRTDGYEFDIYLGQSIAPERPFDLSLRGTYRLMQLRSMAKIAQGTHKLLPYLPTPLRTTQLVFVYENPIDISFRQEEQRFDVEGSYNIRYHVVKKRIDKVHIRHTDERLTQPGTLALVYFNEADAREYLDYIRTLHYEGLLADEVEQLELEVLQGVDGLKALRVKVLTDQEA
ncbi:GAF domain-containing protein [Pedobacter yulinensis]|uniref:GAF domain-containing protein n=1 Tax=Pedobacter yulinensis TaxID=2126353 RepID=A0A2T3HKQ7_9SPHI|nr:GAF domain-containing protein [Pedobacter yulinensis]PST83014.1 GAF domain-containing protein [Pedobacter yulinensis]